ncbi:MAG TPA: hypothetical protein VHG71_06565 [Verrucomicrobiae bacterium]|nr:hypothetical protein [Verrucomicrobiae bacterium]
MRKLFSIFFLLICVSLRATTTFSILNAGSTNLVSLQLLLYTNHVYFVTVVPSPQSFNVGQTSSGSANDSSWGSLTMGVALSYQAINGSSPVIVSSVVPFAKGYPVNLFAYPGGTNSSLAVSRTVFNYETTPVFAWFKQNGVLQYQQLIFPNQFATYTYPAVNPISDTLSWGYDITQAATLSDGNGGYIITNLDLNNSGSYSAGNDISQQGVNSINQQSSSNLVTQGPISYQSAAQTNIDMAGFNMLASQNNQMLLNQQQAFNYWTNAIGQIYAVRQDLEGRVIVVSNISGSMGGGGAGSSNIVSLSSNVWVQNWPSNQTLQGISNVLSDLSSNLISTNVSGFSTNDDEPDYTNLVEQFGDTNYSGALAHSGSASVELSGWETDYQSWVSGIVGPVIDVGSIPDMTIDFGRGGVMDLNPLHSSFASIFSLCRNFIMWILALYYLQRILVHSVKLVEIMNQARGVQTQAVATVERQVEA